MAAFLKLDATTPDGKPHRKIVVNADSISRIEPMGPTHCALVMRESPSESIFVSGSLDEVLGRILEHSQPPYSTPGR
jgi:hypothetical protein